MFKFYYSIERDTILLFAGNCSGFWAPTALLQSLVKFALIFLKICVCADVHSCTVIICIHFLNIT